MKVLIRLSDILVLSILFLVLGSSLWAQTGVTVPENVQHNNEFFISEYVHIQEGAEVHVLGDVVVGNASAQLENEGSIQVHGNFILAPGAIMKSFNGKLVMRNNYANQNSPQYLEGDFTGINAIPRLVINSNNPDGVVYLKNGNLEVLNRLRLRNGRLRTGPTGHDSGADYPYRVRVLNNSTNAIMGHAYGNSISKYIEGKLERAVGIGPYFFPIGPQPSQGEGIEPFAMNFLTAPPANITGYYDNGTTTPIGSIVNCIYDQADPVGNDDDDDGDDDDQGDDDQGDDSDENDFMPTQYVVDCVAGQWIVEGNSLIYFYDIQFFPSQRVLGQCDFQSYFMSKNGFIENICPVNNFILYEQKFLGSFDIAGQAGPGLGYAGDIAYLESLDDNIPVTATLNERTGIPEKDLQQDTSHPDLDMRIFPNPVSIADGYITLETGEAGILTVDLYDNVGILLASKHLEASQGLNKMDLLTKNMAPGIYNVVVRNDKGSFRSRLAVVH